MNKPRNPRYFPRMKVRGARRRDRAMFQLLAGAFDEMGNGAGLAAWRMQTWVNEWHTYRARHLLGIDQGGTDE
jgi:hypothetical protein